MLHSTVKKRKFAVVTAIAAVVCLLLCSCKITVDTEKFASKPFSKIENPKLTIVRFVDALHEGDFKSCDGMMSNCASIGENFETLSQSDAFSTFLYNSLIDSYKVEFSDNGNIVSVTDSIVSESDYSITGQKATVTYTLTVLSLDPLCKRMNELAKEIGYQQQFESDKGASFETEEALNGLIDDVLETVKDEDITQYYKTREFTTEMEYVGNMWRLELSDELYNTLLGRDQ